MQQLRDANWFKNGITITILIAGIVVGIETYQDFSLKHQASLHLIDTFVIVIFILEIIIKVLAEGTRPWRYFYDPWNVFDFIIVIGVFMPFGGSSVAVLRLLRLLRVLKLVKALPRLQILVQALLKSVPSMGYVSLLLTLLFYVYGVAAVTFFGANDPIHFGDLQTSMLSLFRVVTLEDWTDIMYINMYGCADYGYQGNEALCTHSQSAPFFAALFFVSFVLLGTMIILNLFIGVIMNGMEEAEAELLQQSNENTNSQTIIQEIEGKIAELDGALQKLKATQRE